MEELGEEVLKALSSYIIGNISAGGKAYTDFFKPQLVEYEKIGKTKGKRDGKFQFDPEGTIGHDPTGRPINELGEILELDESFKKLGFTNSYKVNDLIYNLDVATDKLLNPRTGIFIKSNRLAGSMTDLKLKLYNDPDFLNKYLSLLNEEANNKRIRLTDMKYYDIDNMIKNNIDTQKKLAELINQRTKYNLKIKENDNNIMDKNSVKTAATITEKTITPSDTPIPVEPINAPVEQLYAPRFMLGGQDILRLTDVEKLEELKNYTLFDLVTPILEGDVDNLLAIQNDIQKKIRYYNNYPLPKLPKPLPTIPKNIEDFQRPMMNQQPVPYPFRLDNTGNQRANNYYNMYSDQIQTELNNTIDTIKRSNLNPDLMQILNTDKTKKEKVKQISEEQLFLHFRR